jgi:hypothetical protein
MNSTVTNIYLKPSWKINMQYFIGKEKWSLICQSHNKRERWRGQREREREHLTEFSVLHNNLQKVLRKSTKIYTGESGSVVDWGTMLQAGRLWVWVPMRWIFFNLPNPSSHTMALGSTQPLTEMITRNLPGG